MRKTLRNFGRFAIAIPVLCYGIMILASYFYRPIFCNDFRWPEMGLIPAWDGGPPDFYEEGNGVINGAIIDERLNLIVAFLFEDNEIDRRALFPPYEINGIWAKFDKSRYLFIPRVKNTLILVNADCECQYFPLAPGEGAEIYSNLFLEDDKSIKESLFEQYQDMHPEVDKFHLLWSRKTDKKGEEKRLP